MTTLRVGINARQLGKPKPTGISRYTEELLRALAIESPQHEYHLFGIPPETVPESIRSLAAVSVRDTVPPAQSGLTAHLWEQSRLPVALRNAELDLFHTPGGNPPFVAPIPTVTTVHDIAPVVHPEWFSESYALLYRATTPLAVRTSTHLITVSEFTREELLSQYPSADGRVTVVHNGVAPLPSEQEPVTVEGDFLLFVGGDNPRKNGHRVLDAYRRYRNHVDEPALLLVVGAERGIFDSTGGEAPGVRRLGYVADEQLSWLYRHASALVYPSLYEGFGVPILEAMEVGTPVITSEGGATGEVADSAACLVDPQSVPELTEALLALTQDERIRSQLVKRGHERYTRFDWNRAADEVESIYQEVAGS
jgi:glycosyltransferase involved in cell wall biosynthesis